MKKKKRYELNTQDSAVILSICLSSTHLLSMTSFRCSFNNSHICLIRKCSQLLTGTVLWLTGILKSCRTCHGRVVQYSQIDFVGVSGDKEGVHWFYWVICVSLRGLIILSCGLAGYRAIPMVHWYQWYDWYQQKMMSFQWFFWLKCVSLRGLRLFSRVAWLGTGQFRWSIGTNGSTGFHPHVREPKTVLDSGLYAMDSGFKVFVSGTWILDSNRHRDSGFLKRYFGFQSPGFRKQKFPEFRNLYSLTWSELFQDGFWMVSRRAFIYVESIFLRVYDRICLFILFYFIFNSPMSKIELGSI